MVNRTASIGLAVALTLAPLGVLAQTSQPAASASAASAIPRTGAGPDPMRPARGAGER